MTTVGLTLRIAAARGDLWLDEITSIHLVQGASVFDVVFAMPYDNNHVLNSAWLVVLGPHPSSLMARLPAIVFGTLCVPVAARIGARRNAFAGAIAALIVALDGLLVTLSSEARGYAGLILATLVALDALETYLDDPSRRGGLVAYGVAIAVGTLSQIIMVASSGALVLAAASRAHADHGRTREAWRAFQQVLDATARGTLPAFVCLVVSAAIRQARVGSKTPFSVQTFVDGYGRMVSATVGTSGFAWDGVTLVIVGVVCAMAIAIVPRHRRVFPLVAIFGVAALRIAASVPNEQFVRFHLIAAMGLVILAVELAGLASDAGWRARGAVSTMAIVFAFTSLRYDADLARGGRGSYRAPVETMAAGGPTAVVVRAVGLFNETSSVIGFYDAGKAIRTVRDCDAGARWLLVVVDPNAVVDTRVGRPPDTIPGTLSCDGIVYTWRGTWDTLGISGYGWRLYQRS